MAERDPVLPELYRLLASLRPGDMSEAEWARRAGVSSSFFQDVKKGRRPRADNLEKVVQAIGLSPAQFYALESPVRTEVAAAGLGDVRRAFHGTDPLKALPLLGTAIGGTLDHLDENVDLVELHLGEVLDYLKRPASLERDPDAYALTVLNDSMSPKFEPGDQIAVSPRSPVSIGDYVIVQLKAQDGEDERIKMVLIKRLVRRTASYVELAQFNPEMTFQVEGRRVAKMHRVQGVLF